MPNSLDQKLTGTQSPYFQGASLEMGKAPEAVMLRHVKPMLATLVKEPFDDPDWLFETKWDGFRAIGAWDGKKAELYSRNGNDFSQKYPPVFEALSKLKHQLVIDGEIVAVDSEGHARFEWLQDWGHDPTGLPAGRQGKLTYFVFDLLWCDGHDLRGWPLDQRKAMLKKVLPRSPTIRFSDHIKGQGKAFFKTAQNTRLEGIMAKLSTSPYRTGVRSRDWLKIKTHLRQEVVIGGFTEPRGSRKYLGALILGVYEKGKLVYVGHGGSAMPTDQLKALRRRLNKLEIKDPPFDTPIKPNAPVHWVQPKLVAEVSFAEWTADGRMRQPIFVGLRPDKIPTQVHRELPKKL